MSRCAISRRGMTLVEILFAFAIISSVIFVAYASAIRAYRTAQASNQRTQAQYVAQDAIERVKAYRDTLNFRWSAAANSTLPGTGGFLQEIEAVGGADGFFVASCDTASEPCEYKIVGGPLNKPDPDQRISDQTDYNITMKVTGYYLFEAGVPDGSGEFQPSNGIPTSVVDRTLIQAISVQTTVVWDSATGAPGSLTTDTIIGQSGLGL